MRKQLLTSAAIILATASVAVAQSTPATQDRNQQQPAAQQPAQQNMNQGSGSAQNQPARSQTSPPPSAQSSQPAQSNQSAQQPSSTTGQNQPASAQSNQGNQPSSAQSNQPNQPSSAQSNQGSQPNQPASAQSQPSQSNQPASAQTNQTNQPASAQTNQQQRNQPATAGSNTNNQPATANQNTRQQQNTAQDANRANTQVSVNREQQTRISTVISRTNVRPLDSVNFAVSVGTVVPATVTLTPLPADIVSIVPQYRGYSFFVVRDEIVIVEPSTKKIVTVISKSGNFATAGSSTTTRKTTKYTPKQREAIRSVRTRATTGASSATEIQIGDRVPDTIELQSFDTQVVRTVPTVKTYRYVTSPRGVYLVDPQRRVVIEEID
jgi:hypothetical protein